MIDVVVLGSDSARTSSSNIAKIVEWMGASSYVIPVPAASEQPVSDWPSADCLVVDADTLASIADSHDAATSALKTRIASTPHVFVYGFQSSHRHQELLRELTADACSGSGPLSSVGGPFRVSECDVPTAGQLAGLSLGRTDATIDRCFAGTAIADSGHVVLSASRQPVVVRTRANRSNVWLSACGAVADLDTAVNEDEGLLPWFSRLAPLMLFLRAALGSRVWRSLRSRACFIIDDPFLKDHYGFLEFSALLEAMRADRFSTSIAFIPWNYRRSRQRTAALFASQAPLASLCVHGCDHTSSEYGTLDADSLYGRSRVALDRMRAHQRKFGVPCDEVMVFPQGVFSSKALRALEACGYLAAVNSHLCPVDMPGSLALRDLLEVATTRFSGVPLFGRRYPTDPAEFAFDLFLGKPALVVEHHGYFRDGGQTMREFAARLRALDQQLEWTNLATICAESCLTRADSDGSIHVRFFTNRFRAKNSGGRPARYVLVRKVGGWTQTPTITVNGRPYPSELRGSDLVIDLHLDPGQSADVAVNSDGREPAASKWRQSAWYRSQVLLRRLSCDVRDDYIETSRTLSHVVSGLRGALARSKPSTN